jgi:hypothetical protein
MRDIEAIDSELWSLLAILRVVRDRKKAGRRPPRG